VISDKENAKKAKRAPPLKLRRPKEKIK